MNDPEFYVKFCDSTYVWSLCFQWLCGVGKSEVKVNKQSYLDVH